MKSVISFAKFVLGALAVLAAELSAEAIPRETPKVGVLLTLSGDFGAAGEECRIGTETGLAASNPGTTFLPIYADSRNSPATSVTEYRKLAEFDKVAAVYTHRSSIGMAINPISLRAGIPLLGAVGHKDFTVQNKFAFQIWPRSDEEGSFLATEFIKRGYKKSAMIFTEDEWTSSVSEGFRGSFAKLGGTLLIDESVIPSEKDLRTLLLKIKKSPVDAVYMNMLLPQIAVVLKQARELEISVPLYFNFYAAKKEVLEAVGREILEGVKYVEMDTDLPKFRALLGSKPESAPPGLTLSAYVATLLIKQALLEVPSPQSPAELYHALLKQQGVWTPDVVYPIENRQVKFPLAVKVFRQGRGQKE